MFYKLKNYLNYSNFNKLTRSVFETPPVITSENIKYSIHSLVCERDIQLYLLSIKSFCSRVPGGKVFAHSDGSLSQKSVKLLNEHIKGIMIIYPENALEHAKKSLTGKLLKIRSLGGCFDRLIDSIIWCEGTHHIQMDSDIITMKNPQFIHDWLDNESTPFVLSHYKKKTIDKISVSNQHLGIQRRIQLKQEVVEKRTGFKFNNINGLNAGFYGWTNQLKLEEIEGFVTVCEELDFDMSEWGAEQVTTTWLLNAHRACRLPEKDYVDFQKKAFEFRNNATMIHFIGQNRFINGWYVEIAKKEIKRLKEGNKQMQS